MFQPSKFSPDADAFSAFNLLCKRGARGASSVKFLNDVALVRESQVQGRSLCLFPRAE
jgi:hypothetical protein